DVDTIVWYFPEAERRRLRERLKPYVDRVPKDLRTKSNVGRKRWLPKGDSDPSVQKSTETDSKSEAKEKCDLSCVACLDEPRAVVLYPCRHVALCKMCFEQINRSGKECPICRSSISTALDVIIS